MRENDNLLNDLEDKYLNKKRRCNRRCKILSLILIIILIPTIIIFIIIFNSQKKNNDEEQKEIKENELKEINEKKKEINEREKVINEKDKEIKEKEKQISDKEKELEVKDKSLTDKEKEIKDKEKDLQEKEGIITEREKELKEKDKIVTEKEKQITDKEKQIADKEIELKEKDKIIAEKEKVILEKEKIISDKEKQSTDEEKQITNKEKELKEKEKIIAEKENLLSEKEKQITDEEVQITDKEKKLKEKEIIIEEKEKSLIEKEKLISDKEKQITDKEIQIKDKENQIAEKVKQITDKEVELKEKDKIIIEKEINEREKVIKEKEKEFEELNNHPYLDTIPDEELKQARNSFNQNIFINPDNSKISLSYNFFIPENYTSNIIYPLIVFIGDESTYGKDIILPINKTVGGPIWATKTVQKKHKCFVLVPHFNENIFNNNDESLKKEYSSMIIRLIYKIKNEYNIDLNRIYGTGQAIGAEITLYLIINNPNIFAGSLIISPNNVNETLIASTNTPFTYFDSLENSDSLIKQNDIKYYFNHSKIDFNSIENINPQENITFLNQNINNNLYIQEYKFNFITYSQRTDYQTGKNNKNEIFKYGYRPEAVREWLFSQNKMKCDIEYYYSEEKGKCFSRTKKKIYIISYTNGDLLKNLLKNSSLVSKVDIGNKDIISKISKNFLEYYDCIIYDFMDGGTSADIEKEKENIKSYINSGGSFLVTHDRWDEDRGPLDLIGLYRWNDNRARYSMSTKAKVSRFCHPIFDSYYNLTDWRVIEISETHKSFHKIKNETNTARVVMELDNDFETGDKFDYLTVNEVGNGRIAYWAAGHHYNISNYEQKLFINIVSWLTKNKQ